jgi:hypothetical protein
MRGFFDFLFSVFSLLSWKTLVVVMGFVALGL